MARTKGAKDSDIRAPKGAGGRPTEYNPKYHIGWGKTLAESGKTVDQIADAFGVATSTVSLWLKEHKEFSEAITVGRTFSDSKVERALYELATGYEHDVEKPMVVSQGQGMGSEVEVVKYRERVPPNPTAMIFWLKNRKPKEWRDKQDHAIGNPDGTPLGFLKQISGRLQPKDPNASEE